MINILPWVVGWSLLALVVIALIVYRKKISNSEDDILHVSNTSASVQQSVVARKLEVVDRWGKILTAIAFVYGLVVLAIYFYNVWNQAPTY
jgi:hypothetical protein